MSSNSTTQSEVWTIMRLLQWTTEHLKKHGSSSPRLDAEVLLAEARGCQRIDLYTAFDEQPGEPVKAAFRELIRRRAAGEPVAYLVGKKEFYSLSFRVSPDCLIPRGETEHIVVECLDRIKKQYSKEHPLRIADVCTGSGCIAVAVAKHVRSAHLTAVDISPAALAIARYNIEQHGLNERIEVVESDLLNSVSGPSFDFVLTNPPYVSESEFAKLDKTVREFEPRLALVSGETGTEIIERLIEQSANRLNENGWFICELSPMIADSVLQRLESDPRWSHTGCVRDLAGLKRIVVAQRKAAA